MHPDPTSRLIEALPVRWRRPLLHLLAALASGLLIAGYARGGGFWTLGVVVLVPWLLVLRHSPTTTGVLASAWLICVAYVLGALHWFAAAFGAYVGIDGWLALLILIVLAPLLQPQIIAFALVRHWAGGRFGAATAALAGAAAWVAAEWALPKLLGDTLGHGLQPSLLLRQAADLAGAAGLSFALLLCNEALAHALARLRSGWRAALRGLAVAAAILAGLTAYGSWRLGELGEVLSQPTESIRVGLVQANITDLEARRAEQGSYAVVRELLDTHFAMSAHAVQEQGAEAVVWSETIYPTTFGSPKSADGAELDGEILGFARELGVPLVFGTYDRDAHGEYNSAAFVDPSRGLLGHYRKTHPFPLTEWVPAWADSPWLRRLLPWAGSWLPGEGARVLPLRTADGREVNVVPLICLDDVRPQLGVDGARLGAEAIIGLSNDAWFTDWPAGARLHLAVASFRSIETRLPQLRVTTNGLSALVDESGEIVASTAMGQQAVLVGEIPLRPPPVTLMQRWGDWLGRAGLCGLVLFAVLSWAFGARSALDHARRVDGRPWESNVALLSPFWRALSGLLRLLAAGMLVWLAWRMHSRDGWQVTSLAQIHSLLFGVLAPALAAWALQRAFRARALIASGRLVLEQPSQRIEVPLGSLRALEVWRLPLPGPGLTLHLASGRRWPLGLQFDDPLGLHTALREAGATTGWARPVDARLASSVSERARCRHQWLDQAWLKFGLCPLLLALPAFRLHQHIAFGGTFGEWLTYGPGAWLSGLLIWWASWVLGMLLFAAALRIVIEVTAALNRGVRGGPSQRLRTAMERTGRVIFYLGVPVWVGWRLLVA